MGNRRPGVTDQSEVEAAESILLELARALESPVKDADYQRSLVSLGQRARTLFCGSLALHASEVPAASRALLRPMVEINLLVRFLRKNPELHTELWHAEGARNTRTIVEEQLASPTMTERWGKLPVDEEELAALNEQVRKARKAGLDAGVVGVGESGAVLPSAVKQLETIKEAAANEAYTLAYRLQSWDIHNGPGTVQAGTWLQHNGGTVSYRDDPDVPLLGLRVFAVSVFASILELLASELPLTIAAQAHEVRRTFVPDVIPPDQRFDAS
jgi:hypothetical protein